MLIAHDRRDEIGIRPDRCVAPSASALGGDPPSGWDALLICVPRTGLFSDPPLTKIRSMRIPLEETWMSTLAQPVVDVAADDHLARRNALVLAVTQALAGGNSTVLVATAGIVGTTLAPDKSLATLPISIYVLGMWMGTLPLGALARRLGRRNALQIGTVCGVLRIDLLSRRTARFVSALQC